MMLRVSSTFHRCEDEKKKEILTKGRMLEHLLNWKFDICYESGSTRRKRIKNKGHTSDSFSYKLPNQLD